MNEDQKIIALYWERSDAAVEETQKKYEKYCYSVAYRILKSEQDAEECVNDTYLRAWESIPPHRPENLVGFLGKLTRGLAINRLRERLRLKRGGGESEAVLEELAACIPDADEHPDRWNDTLALRQAMQTFLEEQPTVSRRIFVQRYFYLCPIAEIARQLGMGESRVKMQLMRMRNALRARLEQEALL